MTDDPYVELERARKYYDTFASTYDRRRDGRGRYHDLLDDLEADLATGLAVGRDVVEVGCGTGLILRRIAAVARRAVGVDLSPRMLDRARARGLEVVEGAAGALPFADRSFDLAVSFKTLPHVPDLHAALIEMARVVRPEGRIVAGLYNPRSVRALVKRVVARRIGLGGRASERDVLCRYDDRAALLRAMPPGWSIVATRGFRTVLPAAAALELPLVGALFERTERALADTSIAARFGGFVSFVLSRTS